MLKKVLGLFCALCLLLTLCCCGGQQKENNQVTDADLSDVARKEIVSVYSGAFSGRAADLMSEDFLLFIEKEFRADSILALHSALKGGTYNEETWYDVTGNTIRVLECYYKGELDPDSPNYRDNIKVIGNNDGKAVIRVTGDMSLADNWEIMPKLKSRGKGLLGVMSEDTVKALQTADITLVNNEFTYSKRGEPLADKTHTFRADPDNVSVFNELGVDIVSLANNHAYDYGPDAFSDTMDTLKGAKIPYIGGGADLKEAKKPFYFIVEGRMVGFSAATKAEKHRLTPEATDTTSGVLRTYDPSKYIEVLESVEKECDYNIAYVHWGKEGSHEIEDGLREMGAQFIDAGADIVIGAHAHLLQGIEYYNGKPIVFNLGNFLFNAKTMDSGILELTVDQNGLGCRFIPCVQSGCFVKTVEGDEAARVLQFMNSLSSGVRFSSDGSFCEER